MANISKIQRMLREAAEKGLDLSPEARKARAAEQGYMTGNDMHSLLENHKPSVELSEVGDNHPYLLKGAKELLVDGQAFAAGSDDYLNQILQHRSDEFLPTSTQSTTGLKRHAYMRMFPSQHTDPDFDINAPMTFYHGTAGDIANFNPNYLGRSTNAASAEHGTFFTNNPLDADDYANIAQSRNPKEARTLDLMSRLNDDIRNAEKHKELYERYSMKDNGGSADFLDKQDDYIERLRNRMRRIEAGLGTDNYSSVYPVHLRPENPMLIDKRGQGYGDITKSLQKAKDQGHDSVVFYDIRDPRLDSTHVVMFDPSKIRSTNAIFDPEKINSRDLLAGFGALGAAGLSMEQEPVQEYAGGGLVKGIHKGLRSSDARRLLNETPSKELRVMRSPEGEVVAWDASEATHGQILKQLNEEINSLGLPDDFDVRDHGWEKDIFALRKGRPISLDDVSPHEDDMLPEEALSAHRDRWKQFYNYASGGKVAKQGAEALRELLENLHKTDPERMQRARDAGFDVDNIHLHGTDDPKIFEEFRGGDGNYIYTSDIPELADYYANKRLPDFGYPRHLPVFTKLDGITSGETSAQGIGGEWRRAEDSKDIRSIFNDFTPESLASEKFAKGGAVKLDPAKNRGTTSDAIETFFRDYADAISLAQSDEMMGNIGGLYAKTIRPELFEDVDMRTLMEAAAANSEAERHRLEEEHPVASIAGMLASVPAYASLGGASLLGQMGANAGLGAAYRYGDHEDPLDPTSIGIDLALPAAFRNLKRTAQGLALAAPAVGLSGDADLELSSLRDLAHNLPDNYRIRP